MEKRKEEVKKLEPEWLNFLEDLWKKDPGAYRNWITLNNHLQEKHRFASPMSFFSPEKHHPSSIENHPFHLFQPEINPYYPNTYLNTSSPNPNLSFTNTLSNLEAYLSCVNLVTSDQNPSFESSNNMGSLPPHITNADLKRMRVQSAARGQMGLYFDSHNMYHECSDDFTVDNYYHNCLQNGGQIRNPAMNRYTSTIMSCMNQEPFQSTDSNNSFGIFSNGGRFSEGLVGNNSSFLRSSSSSSSSNINQVLKFSTVQELKGKICSLAKDRDGSKFLWGKILIERKPEKIAMIFLGVRDSVCELMVDRFGSDFIQKFLEVCDQQQITDFLLVVMSDEHELMAICSDLHGTCAMQKLLEHITTKAQRCYVVSSLLRIAVKLIKSQYGYHVIQNCVESFSSEDNKHLFNVIGYNCVEIGRDKHGCCLLQKCLDIAEGEAQIHLMAEIAANALVLSEDEYGNYVVQYIVEKRIPHVTRDVLGQLVGSYMSLSKNKYGSNVVEKVMKFSGEDEVAEIISEMISHEDFLGLLQDPYGNYVAQSALRISKGRLRHMMVNLIQMHYPDLQSHPFGKRVLTATRLGAATNHRRR